MSTILSAALAPWSSVTVSVMVWLPTGKGPTVGVCPVAICAPSRLQTYDTIVPSESEDPLPFSSTSWAWLRVWSDPASAMGAWLSTVRTTVSVALAP